MCMNLERVLVPPIKCQGIKTKLVQHIKSAIPHSIKGKWIEPFCGSCVVALNIKPKRALLVDKNIHIINFYKMVQTGEIDGETVVCYLHEKGKQLEKKGEIIYYETREYFNKTHDPLAFIFLNRSCFNGVMRFNNKGEYNVPFCRNIYRFNEAYLSKIRNQIENFAKVIKDLEWEFRCTDYCEAFSSAESRDIIYADPPYAGRNSTYYSSWDEKDELELIKRLKSSPCSFLLSTWLGNQWRTNDSISNYWVENSEVKIIRLKHHYHVGSLTEFRYSMEEGIIIGIK